MALATVILEILCYLKSSQKAKSYVGITFSVFLFLSLLEEYMYDTLKAKMALVHFKQHSSTYLENSKTVPNKESVGSTF